MGQEAALRSNREIRKDSDFIKWRDLRPMSLARDYWLIGIMCLACVGLGLGAGRATFAKPGGGTSSPCLSHYGPQFVAVCFNLNQY